MNNNDDVVVSVLLFFCIFLLLLFFFLFFFFFSIFFFFFFLGGVGGVGGGCLVYYIKHVNVLQYSRSNRGVSAVVRSDKMTIPYYRCCDWGNISLALIGEAKLDTPSSYILAEEKNRIR